MSCPTLLTCSLRHSQFFVGIYFIYCQICYSSGRVDFVAFYCLLRSTRAFAFFLLFTLRKWVILVDSAHATPRLFIRSRHRRKTIETSTDFQPRIPTYQGRFRLALKRIAKGGAHKSLHLPYPGPGTANKGSVLSMFFRRSKTRGKLSRSRF